MGLFGTVILYGLIGVSFAAAMVLREPRPGAARVCFLLGAGVLFWPLFAPVLLGGKREEAPEQAEGPACPRPGPSGAGFDPKIRAAEAQLLAALGKVQGGVAGAAMAQEATRVRDLSQGLAAMAARLAEIDEALASPELSEAAVQAALADLAARGQGADDARVQSLRARLRNIERLRGMRGRSRDELERALFKMEEIAAQMRILKFAARPEAEVSALISEIEGGVEGATEAILAVG